MYIFSHNSCHCTKRIVKYTGNICLISPTHDLSVCYPLQYKTFKRAKDNPEIPNKTTIRRTETEEL